MYKFRFAFSLFWSARLYSGDLSVCCLCRNHVFCFASSCYAKFQNTVIIVLHTICRPTERRRKESTSVGISTLQLCMIIYASSSTCVVFVCNVSVLFRVISGFQLLDSWITPTACPETSVTNYHFTLCKTPEVRRSVLHLPCILIICT